MVISEVKHYVITSSEIALRNVDETEVAGCWREGLDGGRWLVILTTPVLESRLAARMVKLVDTGDLKESVSNRMNFFKILFLNNIFNQ
jgi:hypothetical protein